MRISDWSSEVCSSDLIAVLPANERKPVTEQNPQNLIWIDLEMTGLVPEQHRIIEIATIVTDVHLNVLAEGPVLALRRLDEELAIMDDWNVEQHGKRSEEHTSELQSLMRISYAVFCLKKKKTTNREIQKQSTKI